MAAALLAAGTAACGGPDHTSSVNHIGVRLPGGLSQLHGVTAPITDWAGFHLGWSPTRQLTIVTFGSGSCPDLPQRLEELAARHLRLQVVRTGGPICTADLAPAATELDLPAGTARSGPLRVDVVADKTDGQPRSTTITVRWPAHRDGRPRSGQSR